MSDIFPIHPLGYVRHWLVVGPHEAHYQGPTGTDDQLRRAAPDPIRATPPASARLNAPGPFEEPWRFHDPGENFFVEHSAFYSGLAVLDSYGFVEIEAAGAFEREARFWVCGNADLWVNDTHITRFDVPRYMYPDFQPVTLPLRRGINRLCVRLQGFGIRDTCTLVGLQLADASDLAVHVPGADQLVEPLMWLGTVRTEGHDVLTSSYPPPCDALIATTSRTIPWPASAMSVSLGSTHPTQLTVAAGQTLHRAFEIPGNRSAANPPGDLRKARLEFIARLSTGGNKALPLRSQSLSLLARRLLGNRLESDAAALDSLIAFIDARNDCADFALATLLRLAVLGLATPEESASIRRCALAFRYWSDEPGGDAMCFWSENHSLLFHGCQLIAGRLYPGDVFSNSNRTSSEQATLGASRCREWLDRIESHGLEEFNSGTYLPITVAAVLNVIDFSDDADISRRASLLLDRIYEGLALHAFKGVVISPQGRVYRNVLYPEESGTQALLSDATSKALPDFTGMASSSPPESWSGDWLVFPISSRSYRTPSHLDAIMEEPVSKTYRSAGAEIHLLKTSDYLLTSLSLPSSGHRLQPGMSGYQQHLWQATLGIGCHIFVNHPGASFDESKSRPGYWYGNGVLPRLRQHGRVLQAIYDIPDGSSPNRDRTPEEWANVTLPLKPFDLHPIPFTHVHWPSDAFDHQDIRDHWLFGQKGDGCIGVWCSEKLKPHDEVLTGREFRAWASRTGWLVICGGRTEYSTLDAFIKACLGTKPAFDRAALAMQVSGQEPLAWNSP